HFWAIAWISFDDYNRAGYKLLPSVNGRDKTSALQTVLFAGLLLPMGLWPYYLGVTGWWSAIIVSGAGFFFFLQSVELYRSCSMAAALRLILGSALYLLVCEI